MAFKFAVALQRPSALLASTPATQLISSTARKQWRLIFTSFLSAVVAAFSEGLTLAIIFLVVDVPPALALQVRSHGPGWLTGSILWNPRS